MIDDGHEQTRAAVDAMPLQRLREIASIPNGNFPISHLQSKREITDASNRFTCSTLLNPVVKGCSPTQITRVARFVALCAETGS
jgi:hypothetical protein